MVRVSFSQALSTPPEQFAPMNPLLVLVGGLLLSFLQPNVSLASMDDASCAGCVGTADFQEADPVTITVTDPATQTQVAYLLEM